MSIGARINGLEAALARLRREEEILAAEAEGQYYGNLIVEAKAIANGHSYETPTVEHLRALLHVIDGRT